MNHKKMIEDYINEVYMFTSNVDGWCIKERDKNWFMILGSLIFRLEQIFPDMEVKEICTEWYNKNVAITEGLIYYYLSEYKLILGNRFGEAWDVVSNHGQKFNIFLLMTILPKGHNINAVEKVYNRWCEEQKIKETEKLINKNK